MNNEFWMSLTEYSAKHGVSVSTLRRRIKKDEIPYVLDKGKYILPDKPFGELSSSYSSTQTAPPQHKAGQNLEDERVSTSKIEESFLEPLGLSLSMESEPVDFLIDKTPTVEEMYEKKQPASLSLSNDVVGPSALDELKKAYALILQEKEEQITQLKQYIVDLQTLNKAFESEIARLNDEKVFEEPQFLKPTF